MIKEALKAGLARLVRDPKKQEVAQPLAGILLGCSGIAAIITLLLISVGLYVENTRLEADIIKQRVARENPERLQSEIAKTYIGKDSVRHVVYRDRILKPEQLQRGGVSSLVDSVAKVLSIKARQIQEVAILNTKLEGELRAVKVERDSLKKKVYHFSNRYLTASFQEQDSSLRYSYQAEIGITKYSEKSGFLGLGKRVRLIDISSSDPNMSINGLRQVTIEEEVRARPFGIGVQAGYALNLITGRFQPSLGVGMSYNIIRF